VVLPCHIFLSVLVLFAFLVFSFFVLRLVIGWEERLRNDLFRIEWDVKPLSSNRLDVPPRVHR